MKSKKVTLVLGAGSSASLGYPVGKTLREEIISIALGHRQDFAITCGLYDNPSDLFSFVSAFRASQMFSIDAFLARRPEFSSIGKKVVAAILLEAEARTRPDEVESDDHWQRYFFNKFASESWNDLNFSSVSIITFNYDRSFEHYLLTAIINSYGKSEADAVEKLKTLEVVHVYGWLGSPYSNDSDYLRYGMPPSKERVLAAATKIKVIPEGRDDDAVLHTARKMLYEADTICFMGFGFDETNLRRLKANYTCAKIFSTPNVGVRSRNIVASCLGLTHAEANQSFEAVGQKWLNKSENATFPPGFSDSKCLQVIRENLIFG
jgi:hypothetical protein